MIVLSAYQARDILSSYKKGITAGASTLDLGKTASEYAFRDGTFHFKDFTISLRALEELSGEEKVCYILEGEQLIKIQLFSDETNKFYKLYPTGKDTPPTIEISGIRMHCVKDISPLEDTMRKIGFVAPCTGIVLDTCTGLGYTAIEASKTADAVHTFEIDSNVVEIQKRNPWSEELFASKKIIRRIGDIFHEIKGFRDAYFDRIIHDPPRLTLAGSLYSKEFYAELFRVIKPGGKIFHYTGDPGGKKRGMDMRESTLVRMKKAGFSGLEKVYNGVAGIR